MKKFLIIFSNTTYFQGGSDFEKEYDSINPHDALIDFAQCLKQQNIEIDLEEANIGFMRL